MVGTSGTAAAAGAAAAAASAPSHSSSSPGATTPSESQPHHHHHRGQRSRDPASLRQLNTSTTSLVPESRKYEPLPLLPAGAATSKDSGEEGSIPTAQGDSRPSTSAFPSTTVTHGIYHRSAQSRSGSVDIRYNQHVRKVSEAATATALQIRPSSRGGTISTAGTRPRIVSVSSHSPHRHRHQRSANSGSNSSNSVITSPISAAGSDTQSVTDPLRHHRQPNSAAPPVLPDLSLGFTTDDDFSILPGLIPPPLAPVTERPKTAGSPLRSNEARNLTNSNNRTTARRQRRALALKDMLASALQRANTAVKLDNAENYEGAMEAYGDACLLLSQVMIRTGGEEDRRKLETIRDTYTQRINELRQLPPIRTPGYERELPPRPQTEDFTDDASMFTADDDESTVVPSAAPSVVHVQPSNGHLGPPTVPPRRDSLYLAADNAQPSQPPPPIPPSLSLSRSVSSDNIVPPPLSPARPPPSPRRDPGQNSPRLEGGFHRNINRDSFTFGAAALSPRFSPTKADHYGLRRSLSNGSSDGSSLSYRGHSREASEENSTSWLNTIDESGSSNGEPSPRWTRKHVIGMGQTGDFDAQFDAVVEAAYGEGYEVDYSYDMEREEEEEMLKSPRKNVELAKMRVKQLEMEMEMEAQKDRDRRIERERLGYFKPKQESDMDLLEEPEGNESDEERMLEEMTRGLSYDDFDFNLDTKTALPRESAGTNFSDSTLARGSMSTMSSGYSSGVGTTWGSHMTNTSLTTVAESPLTPPAMPPPAPPEKFDKESISVGSSLENSPSKPPPPPPAQLPQSGLAITKLELRSRRLSSLSEGLEPLKIETPSQNNTTTGQTVAIPRTMVQGPSPLTEIDESQPPSKPPPPIPVVPLNIPPKSPVSMLPPSRPASRPASRPGTAHGRDTPGLSSPPAGTPRSPPPHDHEHFNVSNPLTKTVSHDALASMARSESPAKFPPRAPGIPTLRQIHSSASLRNRNYGTPEPDQPPTPGNNGLFPSSSMTNLRKALPRSATPSTPGPGPISNTPGHMLPFQTGGMVTTGMNLFGHVDSPDAVNGHADVSPHAPVPLEPCPLDPVSKPFWLMRSLYQTVAHPRGGFISSRLFIPREVWYIKGVKLKALDDKVSACDLVTAALQKLANVNQTDVHAIYEEMQALEGVLDRAQTTLSKKLGSDVGPAGAISTYGITPGAANLDGHPESAPEMVTTKLGNVGGSGKSYFSIRKLRTKASSTALGTVAAIAAPSSEYLPSLPKATDVRPPQPKRDLDSVAFGGPHAPYLSALAKLFDSAQILDSLAVLDEETGGINKAPMHVKVGLELSHRHAAEFFGFYICRFVLADIMLLLDKFVKRGSEWVAQ